ncbi:MAG TPA: hypothetical protein VN894_15650 [Polyangiaceae bacterium]|nr:hypothetical protein [Polyangiaceae bacterium]
MKRAATLRSVLVLSVLAAPAIGRAETVRLVDKSVLSGAKVRTTTLAPGGHRIAAASDRQNAITGVDSLVNFVGTFKADGVDPNGTPKSEWTYAMVGTAPEHGGITILDAPIVPVSLDLLGADGSLFFHLDVTPFVIPTLLSPVFAPFRWSSSPFPTQYTDAVQRAEFFSKMRPSWHTLLLPRIVEPRTVTLQATSYVAVANDDGTCCAAVLVDENAFLAAVFPATPDDTSTVLGQLERSGEISTRSITTLLFPNTYLTDPTLGCCVLGFHTYDVEPGDATNHGRERRYVMNYSSWMSPGLFGAGLGDVTALSHEMAELFNDPFVASDGVHNVVPWWQSGSECQDVNEVGDVIEGLPNPAFPVELNGMTYHPQNVALLPWFARESVSSAIHHAYSFPDETVLTALSPVESAMCH